MRSALLWGYLILFIGLPSISLGQSKIYWLSSNGIERADLTGSNIETVVGNPGGTLGLEVADGALYWSNGNTIFRAELSDPTNFQSIVVGSVNGDIAIDETIDKIYWIHSNTHKGFRADLDGSTIEEVFGLGTPTGGIALDTDARMLYFGKNGSNDGGPGIFDVAMDPPFSNPAKVTSGINSAYRVAVDTASDPPWIYWAERNVGSQGLYRVDANGNNQVRVLNLAGLTHPTTQQAANKIPGDVEVADGKLYWTEAFGGDVEPLIRYMDLNTFTPMTLVSFNDGTSLIGIALDVAPPSPATVALDTVFSAPGDTVKLDLTMDNTGTSPVGGLQFNIHMGDMSKAAFLGLADTLTSNSSGFTVTTTVSNDTLKVVVFSADHSTLAPGTHLLGRLCFALADNPANLSMAVPAIINAVEIGDSAGVALADSAVHGEIQIGVRGDVDLNAVVTILDVIKLVRIIIESDPAPDAGSAGFNIADMNADGMLNIADVIAQVNDILGITPKPVASSPVLVSLGSPYTLPDGRTGIPVIVESGGPVAGMQMTITFDPAQVHPGRPIMVGQSAGLGLDSHVKDGAMHMVVYGMTPGAGLSAGRQTALVIPVTLRDGAGSPSVILSDMLLANPQAHIMPAEFGEIVRTLNGKESTAPASFTLHAARPNPFNPSTTIAYEVPTQTHITLVVYNLLGQEVVRLVDAVHQPGRYEIAWHGTNTRGQAVASGVYMYRLTSSAGYNEAHRMTLLK